MLKKMILHTLLTALIVGALATAYQARADGTAGIATLLTGELNHDAGHDD